MLKSSPNIACLTYRSCIEVGSISGRRKIFTGRNILQEGDRVLIDRNNDGNEILTEPLKANGLTHSRWGDIDHTSVIGKAAKAYITTSKGRTISAQLPSLAEYISLTPRLVTPIYPGDANLIVSLLDIHADFSPGTANGGPSLEILEAGTGHGALTLHLARAIHAANAPIPDIGSSHESLGTQPFPKDVRQAIVHTVDVSAQYSKHAKQIVRGFCRGMYSNDIDFHVSNVSSWIDQEINHRHLRGHEEQTFLSHIILDMPNSYDHMEKVTSVLHPQGNLILFNPSITQIIAAVETVRKQNIPLYLERVLELGPTMTAGKEWDIRAFKPRARVQAEQDERGPSQSTDAEPSSRRESQISIEDRGYQGPKAHTAEVKNTDALFEEQQGFEIVCRPKAYARVVGGGFVGLWKKKMGR